MINVKQTEDILKEQYNENCIKIDELNEKIQIIKANNFETKLISVVSISLIPWVAMAISVPLMITSGLIPSFLISPLSIGIPAIIGLVGETVWMKKHKYKEGLQNFSKARSKKDLIEECTKYEIEKEKLKNINKILEKACDGLDERQNLLNTLSNEYNIIEKDHRSKEEIKRNYEKSRDLLEQRKKDLDVTTTKKVLKEKFGKIKNKFQMLIESIIFTAFGGAAAMMAYDTPLIALRNLGGNIQLNTLNVAIPLTIGILSCSIYSLKKSKDYTNAFKSLNEQLKIAHLNENKKHSYSKGKVKNSNAESLNLDLENLIDDTCSIVIQLEGEKQKLNTLLKADQSNEKIPFLPSTRCPNNSLESITFQNSNDSKHVKIKTKKIK